jgi:hypothetical protein
MSDTTLAVARSEKGDQEFGLVPLAGDVATLRKGWWVTRNAEGYGQIGGDDADTVFQGAADEGVKIEEEEADGDTKIRVKNGRMVVEFDSALDETAVGRAAYLADNQLMALYKDVSNYVFGGVIEEVLDASHAVVDTRPARQQVTPITS